MATIREMLNRTLRARDGIEGTTSQIVNDSAQRIIELNTTGQLFKGEDSTGAIIGVYSKATETVFGGSERNPPKLEGQPYNFEDTGDFFKFFEVEFNSGSIRFYSTDSKVPELKAKYGDNLFGLTVDHQHQLNYEIIKPLLVAFIRRTLLNG